MEHNLSIDDVLSSQTVTRNGLSGADAAARLAANGENKLQDAPKKPLALRIWEQIRDPMVLILAGAGIVSGAFGEFADMAIIFVVIILNATLGIVQESKAEAAIEALQKMSAATCKVRRDGKDEIIPSSQLVPGDVVRLEAGDSVPADMRLIDSASLKIEEAALTGESVPSEKNSEFRIQNSESGANADRLPQQNNNTDNSEFKILNSEFPTVPLGDRVNMAYMGTSVVYGRGEGVVVRTGMATEMGKIAAALSNTEEERTPLQQRLDQLSKVLSIGVLAICVFIFGFNVFRFGTGEMFESFLTAISLAVAAIPEGLVVVVTVLLSIGVKRMSERGAIIRRLTAVETLGCTEVICSDKTGTLTQNKMTVVQAVGNEPVLRRVMYYCNDAILNGEGRMENGEVGNSDNSQLSNLNSQLDIGDPTEIALKVYGLRGIVSQSQTDTENSKFKIQNSKFPRIGEAPFDSVRKMMTTVHKTENGCVSYTKGAPDEVLARCTHIQYADRTEPLTNALKAEIMAQNKAMADKALRVLAGAVRYYDNAPTDFSDKTLERDLTYAGLCGMIDPVRPEVKAAVKECASAGIRAVMITGDHIDTAVAIAKELDILKGEAITGTQLSEIPDETFDVTKYSVYARVQPEHKVRIVNAWKKSGKIAAMTGDGVNDAPSIKAADIGVGMGITGTDVTKNVADMVLADDNFATIVAAVGEGRRIYENIRKAVQFLLSSNLAEVVAIFIATVGGFKLFNPIHILWINLVTDTFPAMALGVEPAESDAMQKPPRPANASIFSAGLGKDVIWQGIVIALLTLGSYFLGHYEDALSIIGGDGPTKVIAHAVENGAEIGMTMAFLTLSMCEVFHSLNMRSRVHSIFTMSKQNGLLWGAMLLSAALTLGVIYIPGLNDVFKLVPLSGRDLLEALGLAVAIIPLTEIRKAFARLWRRGSAAVA